ncbi:hypothetical protein [Acidovorax cavernicola]|uniref:DUF1311 domain-containing protein n=1 Tax=Acidovorax cavernicola TaxID=1675792 RepID=A0A9X8GUC4_9BURK|nr:hypothetical protein [Acidovorax cavernicola]RIX77898.1 hypothetical protein D3H34_17655 [Acidovorax cavernicola]
MWIIRALITASLLFGNAAHAQAAGGDGTDSHCVTGKDNTLFNKCSYSVDVGFCVENPQQTKNFFDGSDAFRCPNGGLSTLGPGKKEGNILHGTVHWWACSTKHRGTGRWRYVEGAGYRGYCFSEKDAKAGNAASSTRTRASAEECKALQQRALQASGPSADRVHNYTMIEYLDRNCGNLTAEDRAATRKVYQQEYVRLVAECRSSGAKNCDSASGQSDSTTVQRPVTPPTPTPGVASGAGPVRGNSSVESLIAACSREIRAAGDAFYSAQVEADRVFRRTGGGLSAAAWQKEMMEKATQQAHGVLKLPPDDLRRNYKGLMDEAASRANGYVNDRSRHDPHHENALLNACLNKARLDGR